MFAALPQIVRLAATIYGADSHYFGATVNACLCSGLINDDLVADT